jgi:hypothetical protein
MYGLKPIPFKFAHCSTAQSAGQDADAARAARRARTQKSRDENQGAIGGSAGRTLGEADGCAATGALALSAARTCFGAGAAPFELCCAATELAEGAGAAGVTTGCAEAEGMGVEALLPIGFDVEAAG